MKYSILFILALSFSACSSIPKICEPEQAKEHGFGLAMQGKEMVYTQGDVCLEEHRQIFRQNFEAGYQQGRLRYCDPQEVNRLATQRGAAGEKISFNKEDYRICDGTSEQATAFKRGYENGLAEFCQAPKAENDGVAQGESGAEKGFPSKYDVCTGKLGQLKAAYQKGYAQGNAKFCKAEGARDEGMKDGGEGKEAVPVEDRFKACSAGDRKRISRQYLDGYNSALMQFCSGTNIEAAARQGAQHNTSAGLPPRYAVCFRKFSELQGTYERAFHEERERVIQAQCTYQNGNEQGRNDARSSNQKNTGMPSFCNQALFSVYLQGYLEGWKTGKFQICDPNQAYQQGLQDGRVSAYAGYNVPHLCPEEFGAAMSSRFREGWQFSQTQKAQTLAPIAGGGNHCRTEIVQRSGTMDLARCSGSSARIACYAEIKEKCRNPVTGATKIRTYQQFDGRCVSSYANCR